MRPTLIDTHCHLDFTDFDHDRSEIINQSKAIGIESMILPSVIRNKWAVVKTLALQYQNIHPAYGLHPCFLAEHKLEDLQHLDLWLARNNAVAVGECGLDYRDKDTDREFQKQLFAGHLTLAQKYDLPLIIHAVRAVTDVIDMLQDYPKVGGVLHSFSGSIEQAEILIAKGFLFGIGGPVSWENANKIKRMVTKLPLKSIVLESDAPDQPPQNYRGQRNEPAWITDVVHEIANLHSISAAEVAESTTANAQRLFRL